VVSADTGEHCRDCCLTLQAIQVRLSAWDTGRIDITKLEALVKKVFVVPTAHFHGRSVVIWRTSI